MRNSLAKTLLRGLLGAFSNQGYSGSQDSLLFLIDFGLQEACVHSNLSGIARKGKRGGREEQNVNRASSETKGSSSLELFLLVCSWSLFSFQPFWPNVFKQTVWGGHRSF